MNCQLNQLPHRTLKPRDDGFSMVMDKGLSVRQLEDLIEIGAPYIDIVKFGWATAMFSTKLPEKIGLLKEANIPCYFGGTLFEAFIIRNQFKDYLELLKKYKVTYVEVSDGSITLKHEDKLDYISKLAQDFVVLSEVGSKDSDKIIPTSKWIELMESELDAGSWKVIGEAREGGNVGLFRSSGEVRSGLVEDILTKVPKNKIIWEAPLKEQQVWFIKLLGTNVNLGNIAPADIIPLETIRLGLRGDTFSEFL